MSKVIEHNGYLLVEVPEGAKDILLTNAHVDNDLVYPNQYGTFNHIAMIPAGQWEIIGKASEVSEEVWRGIVAKFHNGAYRDYQHKYFDPADENLPFFLTATESGLSLLKSHGMKPETTIILKLKTNE